MSKTYISSSAAHIFNLFGVNKDNAPYTMKNLVEIMQSALQTLHELNASKEVDHDRREYIVNTLTDVFSMFDRYDYETVIGDILVDEATNYRYQLVTVKSLVDAPDWTIDDVGSEAFTVEFERVSNLPYPANTPNAIVWQFYNAMVKANSTIESMRKSKGTNVTAVIVWGYKEGNGKMINDQWLFKVSDQSIAQICTSFKAYLNPNANDNAKPA